MRRAGSITLGLVLLLGATSAKAQSIFDAAKTGTPGQVQAMAAKDAALVNTKDASGKTPLHHAAIVGSVPMIECLLSLGAAIDAATTENMTPLLEAIRSGKDAAANALIEKGAKIDGVLHWAARLNRAAVIETLLAKGADIDARDPQGYTPLTSAARMGGGSFEAIGLLVRKGANFNLPDSLGNTPLDNAIIYGSGDNRTIDLLLTRSAAVNTEPAAMASTLSGAARRGHVRLFEYYLARGGEALLATESTRRSVMRGATMGGSLEMVKALQARGIPLDLTPNRNGATPVHSLASDPKALDMIEFLARNGADVNVRTNDGRSAYNIADAAGNREAASLLLKLGASAEPQQFPRLSGPYLGQTPPADGLRPFAPGIVYLDHGTVSVSPDGQEMYWPTGTAIMMTRVHDGRWTKPAFAPFSGPSEIAFHDDVPFVAPDNRRLFFTSKRPVAPGAPEKENIWFVERTPTGWSEPRSVGPAVNAMSLHWQVSVSNAGTLYFGGRREKDGYGSGDIYCSRLVNGEYTAPVNLGPAINTKDGESQAFIAPDESFILFFRAPGQVPSAYVSFKGRDGQWLPAVTFDLPWAGAGLIVSPDGQYLFAGGQWKSARFLREMKRPEAPQPLAAGWSRMDSGTTNNLTGLWGAAPNDVFAVGPKGTILHFDGRAWSPMATGTTEDLYGIWGTASNHVVAVGGTPMPMPGKGLVLRFDGRTWSRMEIPDSPFLAGVWGASRDHAVAVGVNLAILRFDGKAWAPMAADAPLAPGKPNFLTRTWGSGPDDIYAAGFDGVVLHYVRPGRPRSVRPRHALAAISPQTARM